MKQLRSKILLCDPDSENEDDDDTEIRTDYGYEDVPHEDRILIRRTTSWLLSTARDDTIIYGQGKARIFTFLCNVLEIDYTHIDLAHKSAKRFLYDSIVGLVRTTFALFTDKLTFDYCQGNLQSKRRQTLERV